MTLSAEERLEFEQAGVNPDTINRLMADTVTSQELATSTREVQEVIGPHGSVSRLQSGGVRVARDGISIFEDGVTKTTIDQNGNVFVGSDIDFPSTTTLSVFVSDQAYNAEEMGAGDLLIGDNSAANVFYDASEGRLNFRGGSVVGVYIDTDGSIKAGGGDVSIDGDGIWITNQQAAFGFEDTTGTRFNLYLYSGSADELGLINDIPGKAIIQYIKTTDNTAVPMTWVEGGVANSTLLKIGKGAEGGAITLGDGEVLLWAARDGTTTIFNAGGYDIDFDIYDAGGFRIFHVNAFDGEITSTGSFNIDGDVAVGGDVVATGDVWDNGVILRDTYLPLDGWRLITATWTRTGNHTYTVATDVTAIYRKGTRVRYKDGGSYEYGVIASSTYSSPNTTVTLITNSDYAMAAATITDKYISYIENPEGFPQWFNFTSPTVTPSGSMTWSTTSTIHAAWRPVGKDVEVSLFLLGTTGGTASTTFTITPPIALLSAFNTKIAVCQTRDGSAGASRVGSGYIDSTGIVAYKADVSNWTLGVSRAIIWNGHYPY